MPAKKCNKGEGRVRQVPKSGRPSGRQLSRITLMRRSSAGRLRPAVESPEKADEVHSHELPAHRLPVRYEGKAVPQKRTKVALRRLPRRAPFDSVFAPPGQRKANARGAIPPLIEDTIPLPSLLSLRSKSALEGLYRHERLSARKISRLAGASRAGVLGALDRFGIPKNGNGHKRTGHVPFGFDYLNYRLLKNKAEQDVIRMMRQYRVGGLSLRKIAGNLNQRLVPTKNNGIWQANTVRGILARA